MSKFKVGDKVMLNSVDRYAFRGVNKMKQLFGRTLVVRSVHYDQFTPVVFAGVPGEEYWFWMVDDLRLLAGTDEPQGTKPSPEPTDPAPAAAQKPIRRGDLVEYQGEICVVFSKGADRQGDYWIASLTGEPDYYYSKIDELTSVGSIRKKIKRIKKEMEGGK